MAANHSVTVSNFPVEPSTSASCLPPRQAGGADSILKTEYTWSKYRVQLGVVMGVQVNIHEAKAHLSSLVARAEAGEEVVIARANRPSVRLVPIQKEKLVRRLGEAKGLVRIHDDFDELPAEFMEHFS
jgi:prevent-host-death family protein